jgi:hypothetical protein
MSDHLAPMTFPGPGRKLSASSVGTDLDTGYVSSLSLALAALNLAQFLVMTGPRVPNFETLSAAVWQAYNHHQLLNNLSITASWQLLLPFPRQRTSRVIHIRRQTSDA